MSSAARFRFTGGPLREGLEGPRRRRGPSSGLALAGVVLGLAMTAALPARSEPASRPPERPEAAEPGAYCTPTACRPAPASPWTAAAFGTAAVAIGWRARRRSGPDR